MRIRPSYARPGCAGGPGFSLLEVIIAMAIVGVVFVALYSGLTFGMMRIQYSRENLRATQILMEKMETIRLYNWSQITDNQFIPRKFTATYYPVGDSTNLGVVYTGTVAIEEPADSTADYPDLTANYGNKIRIITVTLDWETGNTSRRRSASTLVTENGLYNYIYQDHYH